MANPWITHVKEFAQKHSLNYREALRHPDIKKDYVKKIDGGKLNIGKMINKSIKKTNKDFNKSIKKTGSAFKDLGSDIKDTYEDAEDLYYDTAKYYKNNLRDKISPVLDKVLEYGGPVIEAAVASSLEATLKANGVDPVTAKAIGKMSGKLTVDGLKKGKEVSGLGVGMPLMKRIRKPKVIVGRLIDGGSFKPG